MMRLLMVTRESELDQLYGLGKSLVPLMTGLRSKGHHVDYLTGEHVSKKSLRAITYLYKFVRFFSLNSANLVWALLERVNMGRLAAKLAKQNNYSHVHMHDPWIAFGFYLTHSFLYSSKSRWGITEHGYGCYGQATLEDGLSQSGFQIKKLRSLERFITTRADWLITPTTAGLDQLLRDLALPTAPANWFVLPHPLPQLSDIPKAIAREKLDWKDSTYYIIAVGRLAPLKRFDLMLRACASISSNIPFHIVILGGGDHSDLVSLAMELGIAEQLTITVTDDVGIYLSAADVYVSSSSSEAFGYANLEALQAGLPCICTAVGGVAEVVGTGAWLVPCNQNALNQAVNLLLNSTTMRTELQHRASVRICEWQKIEELVKSYEQSVE